MKKFVFVTVTAVLVWVALAGLTAREAYASPVVLVDQAHDQRFVIEKKDGLHLSGLAEILAAEGLIVKSSTSALSDDSLRAVDVVVISGPFKAMAPEEIDALLRFLERGGRLAAMLHIGSPFAGLFTRLEVDFTNYVLSEQENIIDNDPKNFQVRSLLPHPLFGAIDHFSLYGGWALINTAPTAAIIASTSPKAWVDLDGDRKLSQGDVVQAFGVVAVGTYGAGRFVVFGDDAIFQNKFLDESNRQLAKNLACWLK